MQALIETTENLFWRGKQKRRPESRRFLNMIAPT
jgi:hypothetical protein